MITDTGAHFPRVAVEIEPPNFQFPKTRQKCESFLPKQELFFNLNKKRITLLNVTAVELEPAVEIVLAVLIEPF